MTSALRAQRAERAQPAATLRAVRTAVAAACFLSCGLAAAQGASAPPAGAQAVAAAPAPVNIVGTYTIHPGQSLHDAAVDLTQSHDKAVLARMASALFDANPQAFNRHDPSLLRANSVLNVPQVPDLSSAASGVTPAAAPAAPAATASAPAASPAAAASNAAAQAVSAASSATAAAAAGASSANAAANAATAASEPATVASAPAAAESAASAATSASAAASSPSASDSHVYSGAIQASAPATAVASGASASGPVHASSLQQLLALKNRVLMALQGHGAGQAAQSSAAGGAPAAQAGAAAQPAANANGAAVDTQVSPTTWGIVVAVLVALVALIAGLFTRKRRKPPVETAVDENTPAPAPHEPVLAAAVAEQEVAARYEAEAPPVAEVTPDVREPVAPVEPLAPEIAHEAASAHVAAVEHEAHAAHVEEAAAPHIDETLGHATEAASLEAAAALGADALPLSYAEPQHAPEGESVEPAAHADHVDHAAHEAPEDRATRIEPTLTAAHDEPETLHDATATASLAAAAELGADALPPESMAHEAELPRLDAEPAPLAPAPAGSAPDLALDFGDDLGHTPRPASAQPSAPPLQPEPEAPLQPQAEPEVLPQHAEPEALPQPPVSLMESAHSAAPAVPVEDMNYLDVPTEFPRDAVEALGDIGLPLPPRIGEPILPVGPLSSEPVATPEAAEHLASPFHVPPAPLVGETIEHGLAGAGALAGLGAPRFGALTLDFDLDLPPDSAEPLPVFTPEQLTRIARNKLDLAQEYISLGDVSGARSLINEVIESNDHATRADAQALLSTLAPLS
ncbi:FimV/HubP family polar landmark protein [Paraburkholderia acidisoli]|uniref:FimV-like protein n=1 Tax=Paraburkholderia acidisoli TaxID=2571748 RepID=A0A7Z2GKV1_9BURK|nr:FimV/HubP family polar landmark protein [Paraburkholderia acidisoli]QGZ63678.1 hypothetical protein FAZ98_18065 [Paraburkholderia acidisoli]